MLLLGCEQQTGASDSSRPHFRILLSCMEQAGSFGWLPLLNTATTPSGTGRASRKGQRLQRHLPAEACCSVVCDQPPGQPNPIRAHLEIPCTEPNPKFLNSALKSAPMVCNPPNFLVQGSEAEQGQVDPPVCCAPALCALSRGTPSWPPGLGTSRGAGFNPDSSDLMIFLEWSQRTQQQPAKCQRLG